MSSADSFLRPGTPRLFAEFSPSARPDPVPDEHGFLTPSRHFFGFERLLDRPCSLVTAPPWIGKSFMAERIEALLRSDLEVELSAKSRFLHRTNLEAQLQSQPLEPSWWVEWQNTPAEATWIIDAVDDGQRKDGALCPALLKTFSELPSPQRDSSHASPTFRSSRPTSNPDFARSSVTFSGPSFCRLTRRMRRSLSSRFNRTARVSVGS